MAVEVRDLESLDSPRDESSYPESLYGILRSEGYNEYFDPPLENKYECPICLLGLREPVQTPCGLRFCRRLHFAFNKVR